MLIKSPASDANAEIFKNAANKELKKRRKKLRKNIKKISA